MATTQPDLRLIGFENLEHAVQIMNESSQGTIFAYHLDVTQFLVLSRFWNFSYAHSYIAYADHQPAGVILNAIDAASKEVYSFYWGVAPQYRSRGLAAALYNVPFEQCRREGYARVHSDLNADSPSEIYKKLGHRLHTVMVELESALPQLTVPPDGLEVRSLEPDELFSLYRPPEDEFQYWANRPFFIRQAARFLDILGAFDGDRLVAHAITTTHPGHTVMISLRSAADSPAAVQALIRFLTANKYPAPYVASFVVQSSACQRLLEQAAFVVTKQFTAMTREIK